MVSKSTLKNFISIIYLERWEDDTALCICRIRQENCVVWDLYLKLYIMATKTNRKSVVLSGICKINLFYMNNILKNKSPGSI